MANQYRKRRRVSGSNKNELKVMRGRSPQVATLRAQFPQVARLSVALRFTSERGEPLDERRQVLSGGDGCELSAECPGRCGVGKFSFQTVVAEAVAAGKTLIESSAPCAEPLVPGLPQTCGCKLDCRIEIEYLPQPLPQSQPR